LSRGRSRERIGCVECLKSLGRIRGKGELRVWVARREVLLMLLVLLRWTRSKRKPKTAPSKQG
jgi:uncharacterized membrane protein